MATAKPVSIVGIGASAGGLEACEGLFGPMPADTSLAFILVTHLARGHHSSLAEILSRHTALPVRDTEDGEDIAPDYIYVCPPDHILTVLDGRIHLHERSSDQQRRPIDVFLSSLAEDCDDSCVGILLSGAGTDGTLGIKAVKERGGFTLAQGGNGHAPAQTGMPDAAIAAGVVDLVLPVENMAGRLADYARSLKSEHSAAKTRVDGEGAKEEELRREIYALLLKHVGHDFSGYKEKTFMRRVRRRMQVLQVRSVARYVDRLKSDRDEVTLLFRDLLIGVTNFFRDPGAFESLAKLVVPSLFENKGVRDTVRVWVPGCATGEEVYSIAIVLREHLDKLPAPPKVQIFATDIDDAALSIARAGRYPAPLMGHVSKERLARFFVADDVTYSVSKDIRDLCMFSAHSLIRDPPFSRIDLVSCRNLLIYFGTDFQATAIPVFHFALKPDAYLFLGTSENVSQFGDLFAPIDKKHRIFRRRNHVTSPLRFPLFTPQGRNVPSSEARRETAAMADTVRRSVENRIAERHAPAHVVVDRDGNILHYSPRTGKYLEPAMGMPTRHLLEMARRGLRLDLRNALNEALEKRRPVERLNVAFEIDDRVQTVNLVVEPFGGSDGDPLFLVIFNDVGVPRRPLEILPPSLEGNVDDVVKRLETELRETRDRLQSSIEEYESGVEELNSSNEELQSMNEELQSTNEELETSKEELQSVNEELQTVNSELISKMEELDCSNTDLKNILDSTQIATIFLDRDKVIRNFTSSATAVFNLIPGDLGRPLTDIVSRLDGNGELGGDIQTVLEKGKLIERRVRRADGSAHYLLRIIPYRGGTSGLEGALVTFVDVSKLVESEAHHKSLVEELNHRVRNVLTIVAAIARQTMARNPSPKDFADAFMGRMQSMARTYNLVSREQWGEVDLKELLNNELGAVRDDENGKPRVTFEGEPIAFRPSSALGLGMIFHELVTNATKHGALSAPKGRVAVHWEIRKASAKALVLTWEENARRAMKKPSAKSYGMELIERELKGTLGATIKFIWGKRGLKAQIAIPADPRRFTIRPASAGN